MEDKSLHATLTRLLLDAKSAHTTAVELGRAVNEDWPEWYASYITKRITPMLSMVQGGPGWIAEASHEALPPYIAKRITRVLDSESLEKKLFRAYEGRRRNPMHVSD